MITVFMEGGIIQSVGCTREEERDIVITCVDYDTDQAYEEDTDVVSGNGAFVNQVPVDFVIGPETQAEIESALKRKAD